MEECQIQETAFLYLTTSVISQINSPNYHIQEVRLLKILATIIPAIKETYGGN